MIVLHAALVERDFLVWGETSLAAPAGDARRKARAPAPAALPFGAGHDALLEGLAPLLSGFRPGKEALQTRTLWLPGVQGQPLASTPLVAPPPEHGAAPVLGPWTVAVVALPTPPVLNLLAAVIDRESLIPGTLLGGDLAFWAQALRFASALVSRQQMLPALAHRGGRWLACWEAAFTGVEAERLGTLARAMPHVCRALAKDAGEPPAVPAAAVLTAFVNAVVDHLARPEPGAGAAKPSPGARRRAFASVHDEWLHALRAADGGMNGDHQALAALAEEIRAWRRPIDLTATAPLRLCFRLEEPAEVPEPAATARRSSTRRPASAPWRVRFLLQPVNDPSLLIEAGEAWKPRSRKIAALKADPAQVREYLLAALGQASGLSARIEASLKSAPPDGYELDATGAHEFLNETAWGLEQAGFGVLLPAWWTGKGGKPRLSARAAVKSPAMHAGGGLHLDAVLRFDWEIALGDTPLSLKELEQLATLKVPLVRIRGQWVQLSADEIRAAIALWKAKGRLPLRGLIQMALGAAPAAEGIDFQGVRADGWVAQLLAQLDGSAAFAALDPPGGLQGTLRPYQSRGYSWLAFLRQWGLGACLADDMGLGKTIQVLALIQRDWEAGRRAPVLLIAPTSVTGNWKKEAERFTPALPVLVHHGTGRQKGPAFAKAAAGHALVVSSYALLARDLALFKAVNWGTLVLDEAQNIKNAETRQAQAANSVPAEARLALTGTPVENSVGELWSIMNFLNPGFLGSQTAFRRRFFLPIQVDRDPAAVERLKRLTGPFILRRLKTDRNVIADLPEKMEMKVFCPLTREQASLYAAVVKDAEQAIAEADGIRRKALVLTTLMKLKQVCNHPAQFLADNSAIAQRSGKLARLTEMTEELLAEGDRALVFTQFTEMGHLLQRHLQEHFGREVLFLHGGTTRKARDRMVERFQQADGAPALFLLSLKAGGTGLNLTAANHVFHFDRWWNPAVENQATDRAFRIGQTRRVQVHKFLCQGTVEEKIDAMIERKLTLATQVVGSGEAWLTELSGAELKDLFALRAEAVQE